MKKLFHRKKDSNAEKPAERTQALSTGRNNPALRTSLYESTTPGETPQTGDYPVKGNDSSVMLQQGRKSSVSRSRRSSGTHQNIPYRATTPDQYEASKREPHMAPPPVGSRSSHPYQQSQSMPMGVQEERRRRDLPQDLSGLNLGNVESPTTVTQTVTTTRTPNQGHNANRSTHQNQGYAPSNTPSDQGYALRNNQTSQHQNYASRNNTTSQHQEHNPQTTPQNREYATRNNAGTIRPVNEANSQGVFMSQTDRGDMSSSLRPIAYDSPNVQDEDDAGLARENSIPRKQIGTSANTPYSARASSPLRAQTGHSRQQSASKPLPSTPTASSLGYTDRQTDSAPQPSSILNRSRPIATSQAGPRDAQDVVDRAKMNTRDTEVVETVAPAVVHEKVLKAVHHVREEVITREIHTHDVYHRILPIVDVEVLPPRHFLPVEGGGLVEISASEVPGRGSNWVIAETASNIPSDQAAPPGTTQFTARKFPGREGDSVTYMTPEGYERSEETWVHPPELEEGARLTGQSWPMVMGEEPPGKGEHGFAGAHGFSTPKATKRKSPKKSPAVQASSAQRAGARPDRA